MKLVKLFGFACLFGSMVACGSAGEGQEDLGTSDDPLVLECMGKIGGRIGSREWQEALRACIDEEIRNGFGGGGRRGGSGRDAGAPKADSGNGSTTDAGNVPAADGGSACSIAVTCDNGTCRCSAGPNAGQVCDGSGTGPAACNLICRFCQ